MSPLYEGRTYPPALSGGKRNPLPRWEGRLGLLTAGVQSLQHRGQRCDRLLVDGIQDELDVPDSLARVGPQTIRDRLTVAFERLDLRGQADLAPAGGSGQADQDGNRALHLTRVPPGRNARGIDFLAKRFDPFGPVADPLVPRIPAVNVGHR